jgi:putative membrane protein
MARGNSRRTALVAALASLGIACAANGASQSDAAPVSNDDRAFVQKAAEAGMTEIEVGKLAQQKGSDDAVKQLGRRMVDDHTKANGELKKIAGDKGIDVPAKLDKSGEKEVDQLSKLSGSAFDQAFVKHEVSDHQKAVKAFDREAKSGKDSDLKSFASQTLPDLQEHLKLAQSAQKEEADSYLQNPANKASRKGSDTMRAAVKKADNMPSPTGGAASQGGNR